jgi:hypothetical protein
VRRCCECIGGSLFWRLASILPNDSGGLADKSIMERKRKERDGDAAFVFAIIST